MCEWINRTCGIVPYCYSSFLTAIIIIKKDWQCKAGRGRLTPYKSEDPSNTLYQPIEEKKRKGK